MMARAHPKLALRPFLPADVPMLAEIFRASIEELTADDYSDPSARPGPPRRGRGRVRRAARQGLDPARHDGRLAGRLRLARGPERLDMLYVHPAAAGHGVGSMLIDALEKLAASRGAPRLTADVSDSAEDFFKRRVRAAAAQHRSARRRVARQHHDGKEARRQGAHAMKHKSEMPARASSSIISSSRSWPSSWPSRWR